MENENPNPLDYGDVAEKILRKRNYRFLNSKMKEGGQLFGFTMQMEAVPSIRCSMHVSSLGSVKIWTIISRNIPSHKRQALLNTLNDISARLRFIRLCLDSDNDICASYDMSLFGNEETAEEQLMFILFVFTHSLDECLPEILPILWQKTVSTVDAPEDAPREIAMDVDTELFASEDEG